MLKKKLFGLFILFSLILLVLPLSVQADGDTEPPTIPTNLETTEITANSILLSWDASTDNVGVAGYEVYNGQTLVDTVTQTSYTFSNLSPATEYTLGVIAKDAAGNPSSKATLMATTLLQTPANLSTTAQTTEIALSWDTVNTADSYEVYNGQTLVDTVATTSYLFDNLTAGTEYTLGVIAKSSAGNESDQAAISCYTLLDVPTNVSVTPYTTAIDISWGAVSTAQTYEVKVNDDTISNITGTSYTYQGLTPGESYSVQVRGMNENTNGVWCPAVTGTTNTSTYVSGSITQDTTWTIDNSPYDIGSNSISIDTGVTLTIEPGVIVKANYRSGASIYVSGTLNAPGTYDTPIIFTSASDAQYGGAGNTVFWPGIEISSTGELNANYIKIRYAGGNKGTTGYTACNVLKTNGKLSLSNSEITNVYGNTSILVDTSSTTDISFNNNTIHYNSTTAGYGIYFSQYIGGVLTFEGNTIINDGTEGNPINISIENFQPTTINGLTGYNNVKLNGGSISHNLSLPQNQYDISTNITIPSNVTLTLASGTVMRFERTQDPSFVVSGTLNATGTSENPIIFTSASDTQYGGAGSTVYWQGIDINATGELNSDNIKIRYAGGDYYYTGYTARDVLRVYGKSSLSNSEITNVYGNKSILIDTSSPTDISFNSNTIHYNSTTAGYGIYFSQYIGGVLTFEENTIINDGTEGEPIWISMDNFQPSTINGLCGYNHVRLSGTSFQQDLTLPQNQYEVFLNITIPEDITLTLTPGTVMRFQKTSSSQFIVSGILNAIGTAEDPIVFTSISDTEYGGAGSFNSWQGLDINATGELNADYTKIRYAGARYSYSRYSSRYAIIDNGKLNITNSEITDIWGYGISISGEVSDVVIEGNAFSGCDTYGIYINTTSSIDIAINDNIIVHESSYTNSTYGIFLSKYNGGVLSLNNNSITTYSSTGYAAWITMPYFCPTEFSGLENVGTVKLNMENGTTLQTDLLLPKNIYELYSYDGQFIVPYGKTLTFGAGSVIKTNYIARSIPSILVEGSLNVIGTSENPIILTSTTDPLFGGNGSAYWRGIKIASTGEMNADYVRIRYAGEGSYYSIDDEGNLSITNSELAYSYFSDIKINNPAVDPIIKYNSFIKTPYYAIYNITPSSLTVDAKYNYWGSNYGPNTGGCRISSGVLYIPYYGYDLSYMHHFGQEGVYGPSGSFSRSYTDMSTSNSLQAFEISRTYNSKDDRDDTLFGRGWTLNFEGEITDSQSIITTEEDGVKTIDIQSEKIARASNGAVYIFEVNANGTFTSKYSKGIKLVKNANGTYTLTTNDQTQILYNADGKMASVTDKYGNTITINYTDGKISSIVDSAGNIFSFTYNANGRVIEIEDVSGNRSVTYEYSNDILVRAIDPTSAITRYSYDSADYLTEIRDDDSDLIESVTYDHTEGEDQDKVSQTTDAYGNTVAYSYDNVNRIVTMTDSNGRLTKQWYDESLYITREQDPENESEFTTYSLTNGLNKYGEVLSTTDRNGNQTSYTWDANGNMTQITNPDSSTKHFTYDNKNNLISVKDEDDKMTYYVYDANMVYLEKKAQPLDGTTVYDGVNDSLFAITQYVYYSESERTTLGYELKGLLKTVTDSEGGMTTYTYDSNGNFASIVNALGKTTTYTYNNIGWLLEEVSPSGYETDYTYNKNGIEIKKVLDGGETYRTVYDDEGRIIKEIQPNQYEPSVDDTGNDTYSGNYGTRYTYYDSGEIMTMTDAEDNITSYTYDDYGNIETETKPDGSIYRYEYDDIDRTTAIYYKEDASSSEILLEEHIYFIYTNGETMTVFKKYIDSSNYIYERYMYDYAERLIETENPDSTTVTTEYNDNGTVYKTTDTNGKSTYYNYDGLNRVTERWVPFEQSGSDILYTYTAYTYDKTGRVTLEETGKSTVLLNNEPTVFVSVAYTYYDDGNLESEIHSSGMKTEYEYDNDGYLSGEKHYTNTTDYNEIEYTNNYWGKPDTKKVYVRKGDIFGYSFSNDDLTALETQYTYDDNGNIVTETNPDNVMTTYSYDHLNRQTGASQPGIDEYGSSTTITTSKEYDYMGNVVSKTDANNNETIYEYNGLGQQVKIIDADGGTMLNEYDWLGRATAIVSPVNYDSGLTLSEMNRSEFTYDEMGRLITMSQVYYDTGTTTWVSYVSKACAYDNNGNLTKELDALGYAAGTGTSTQDKIASGYGTENTYNYANLLLTTLDAVSNDRSLSYTVSYTYDALGRKVSETNASGVITNYYYDDAGNVTSIKVKADASSAEQTIKTSTYDELGHVLIETDGNGNTTTYEYNALGEIRSVTYPYDTTITEYVVSSQYDEAGNLAYNFDNSSAQELYTYDNQGRLLSYTKLRSDETQAITTYKAYDENGNMRFETDGNGDVTEYEYDVLNRVVSTEITVSSVTHTTAYTYDESGNKLTETDWLGNVTTYEYDSLNRLVATKDANDVYIEKLTYNNNDAQVTSTDALNNVTEYTYDKNNRLISTEDSGGDVTGQSYDDVGNIRWTYDGETNFTTYDYDEFNRLVEVTDADSNDTTYTYDLNGNRLTQTDGNGHVKTYEYNVANLVIRSIDDGGRTGTPGNYIYDPDKTITYTYYNDGVVHTMTDRNGNTVSYTYDIHNRMLSKTVGSISITYTYDNVGNQLTVTDSTGTTARTYDELGRVLTKTVPVIGTTTYVYDITSGLTAGYVGEQYTDPASNVILKVYDKVGRLYTVTDGSDVTTYTYYDNGARESITYPNGAKEEYTYTEGTLLTQLINRRPDNSVMDQYTYTYDGADNMLTKYEVINGTAKGTTTYTYDDLNRLETVTEPGGKVTTYTYDDAGNRETETIVDGSDTTVNTYTYNEQNRLTNIEEALNSVTQNEYDYDYDENGNQTTVTVTPYVNGVPQTPVVQITNSYDGLNQLTQSVSGGITSTYTYNGEGLRVKKSVDSTITRYLYQYTNVILETDNSGNEIARNVYGTNLLIREVDSDSYYYFYNGHADVTALMDVSTDTVAASYYYDAFGNILESTGSVDNNICYAGYQYDEETGYYYLNARMYDPVTARFLQEDTYLGDPNDPLSLNLYTYGRNNPLRYYDPTGHAFEWLKKAWNSTKSWVSKAADDTAKAASNAWTWTKKAADDTAKWVSKAAEDTAKWVSKAADDTAKWVSYEADRSWNALKHDWESVKSGVTSTFKKIDEENAVRADNKWESPQDFAHYASFGLFSSSEKMEENYKAALKPVNSFGDLLDADRLQGITNIALEYGTVVALEAKAIQGSTAFTSNAVLNGGGTSPSPGQVGSMFDDAANMADFYVKPTGEVIPSTGYRYMDTKYAQQTLQTNKAPGSYFSFDKFNSANEARDALQISSDWSNAGLRGEFDTLQIIDDIRIPYEYGDTGNILEPFTKSYTEFGKGGYTQAVTDSWIEFKPGGLEFIER